jgi:hypothetical protein
MQEGWTEQSRADYRPHMHVTGPKYDLFAVASPLLLKEQPISTWCKHPKPHSTTVMNHHENLKPVMTSHKQGIALKSDASAWQFIPNPFCYLYSPLLRLCIYAAEHRRFETCCTMLQIK